MSFWNTSEGEKVKAADNIELEGGGGDFLPIPAGTDVKVAAEETKWDTTDNDGTFISIKWQVLAPAIYKGRKIFQKVKVLSEDKKVKDKALRMFGVIATNAGGELLKSNEKPTDDTLTKNITNKIMVLKLDVWEIDKDRDTGAIIPKADRKSGNWVKGVAAKTAFVEPSKEEQQAALQKQQAQHKAALAAAPAPQQSGGGNPAQDFDSFDDDIPF